MQSLLVYTVPIVMTLISLLFSGCGKQEEEQKKIRPVRYTKARSIHQGRTRAFAGITKAGVESKLSFRVPGIIVKLPVEVGDHVLVGMLIAKLDPYGYQLKVEEAKADLLSAEAKKRQATANYGRTRDLYETRSASRAALETARAHFESAGATVQVKTKAYEQALAQQSYAELRAPIEGDIAVVNAEVNENVKAGQVIVELASSSEVKVVVPIPETYIAQINEDQKVDVTFPSVGKKIFTAVVTEVGIASRTATTFPVTVTLVEKDQKIFSGMTAEVNFFLKSKSTKTGVYLPPESVLERDGSHYVYIVEPSKEEQGVIRLRKVEVGNITNDGLEVISGVEPDELIVTAGIHFIRDGTIVKVLKEQEVK